jgi:hypothetical protein
MDNIVTVPIIGIIKLQYSHDCTVTGFVSQRWSVVYMSLCTVKKG